MSHFDHIPPGKREMYNKASGKWELIDAKDTSVEDLKITLDERNAELEDLRAAVAKPDKIIAEMNQKIISLESKKK